MKQACVIDQKNMYVTFVLVNEKNDPQNYMLKEGEKLVEIDPPIGFLKPVLEEGKWEESATSKEIQKEEKEKIILIRNFKKNEIEQGNELAYSQGVTVTTSLGEKTFSLTSQDQMNITGLQSKMLLGDPSVANGVPYHANGEFCTWWSHEDFTLIATKASEFVFYHTSYINFLNRYIEQIDTVEELENVYYGMELPKELAESFANFMKD